MKRAFFFTGWGFLFAVISGCSILFHSEGPLPIKFNKEILVLAWDDDIAGTIGDTPSSIAYFNIYYRSLGTMSWRFLQSTVDDNPSSVIRRIGFGNYEFAVQFVCNNGDLSGIHASSDFSAIPVGGWYLQWE